MKEKYHQRIYRFSRHFLYIFRYSGGKMKTNVFGNPQKQRLLEAETSKSLVVKVLEMLATWEALILLVPEVGIEPTRAQGPLDFESSASTSFTTPAHTLRTYYS